MNATATSPQAGRCAERAAVDQHFARRLSPTAERALREHLPGCAACHAHYQRRLTLERLDPRHANAAQARLATALGLQRRALPAGSVAAGLALTALLTVGVLAALRAQGTTPTAPLTALRTQQGSEPASPLAAGSAQQGSAATSALPASRAQDSAAAASPLAGAFAARGAGAQEPSVLRAYRIRPGHAPALAESELGAKDELAFGYLNPASRPWLLVYGVDEHGHVYWFHPSWDDAAEDPAAVRALPGAALHELPEAISHALDGRTLTVHGVLSERRLTVRQVEALRQGRAAGAPLPLEDAEQTALELRVTP